LVSNKFIWMLSYNFERSICGTGSRFGTAKIRSCKYSIYPEVQERTRRPDGLLQQFWRCPR
jgi:hypothetical protein